MTAPEYKRAPKRAHRCPACGHRVSLTPSDVRAIKRQLREGVTGPQLAAAYGVTRALISLIKLGRVWKHVR